MKKFAMLLAAGVIALGASAQAADVQSVTYAVITVPVAAGNNFIGVSVAPIDGTADTFADILGVDGTTPVKLYSGSGYTDTTAGQVTANPGTAVYYDAGSASTIYEVGVAQTATASVSLNTGFTLVANPFAEGWAPTATSLSEGSNKRYGANANKIHVWNGTGWTTVWFKTGTGWQVYGGGEMPSIGAAQAVLVEKGGANTATAVTFTAAQ